MKRRVVIVGPTRYRLPLNESLAKKFEALEEHFELRVLARGAGEDDRFRFLPGGYRFYAELPTRLASELRSFQPDAVLAQDPHTAAGVLAARKLARRKTPLILEVHGNWRTAARDVRLVRAKPARSRLGRRRRPGSEAGGRRPNDLAVHDAARP